MKHPPCSAMVVVATLLAGAASAQTVQVQTDWSGGPGETGPVTRWTTRFSDAQNISTVAIPGQIVLGATPLAAPEQTVVAPEAQHPNGIAAADVDDDGLQDMVVVHGVTDPFNDLGAIRWWRQAAPGVWEQRSVSEDFYGAHFVDTADVDRDGDTDVIAAAYFGHADPPPPPGDLRNGRFAWFENLDGQGGAWQERLVGEMFWGANWIDCGDIDGDGDNDLVGASELTDGIYEQDADLVWFENLDRAGILWAQHDLDLDFVNASEAHLADLDGDLDLDIVATNMPSLGPTNHHWWENDNGTGTSWTKREIPFYVNGSGYLEVGDMDGDGDLDLMGGGLLTGALGFWENLDGLGETWQAVPVGTLIRGLVVRVGDIDGDGDLDVLAATDAPPVHSGLWWFENLDAAAGSFQLHQVDHLGSNGAWLDLGDPDGDGRLDAVVSMDDFYSNNTEQVSWWRLTDFLPYGQLTSSVLDATEPMWGAIQWDATVGASSSLLVEVRGSDDAGDLGSYIAVAGSGDPLAPLIGPSARYLQYRLTMTSSDADESPMVRAIAVDTGFVDAIFEDGFESGTLSAWSSTTP